MARRALIFVLGFALVGAVPAGANPAVFARGNDKIEAASALLRFTIVDEQGKLVPGRLTVVREGEVVALAAEGDSKQLALRGNVAYTSSGRGMVRLSAGAIRAIASRGVEWSVASAELSLEAGRDYEWRAVLRHEVDTRGWVSADLHLHDHAAPGTAGGAVREHAIGLIGEGLEFAVVAPDQNGTPGYGQMLEEIGAKGRLCAVNGNEVAREFGRFNAFPLDPARPLPADGDRDPAALFELIRSESNPYGVLPIIQLNHPRRARIGYFGRLDPVTGIPLDERFSWNFDALEVLTPDLGRAREGPETESVKSTSTHSVLNDWFNLLDLGYSFRAVGNSGCCTGKAGCAGFPRNFIASSADDPSAIDPKEITDALRAGLVFTTLGPFVEFTVNGDRSGKQVSADRASVELSIQVRAASWIDCDRVLVLVNGDVAEEIAVPRERTPQRLRLKRTLAISSDAWVALMVEGDDCLEPALTGLERAVRPLALTNPVWIDFNGDEDFTPPRVQGLGDVRSLRKQKIFEASALEGRTVRELKWMALAAIDEGSPHVRELLAFLLGHREEVVRLSALRAAERLHEPGLTEALSACRDRKDANPYERLAAARALAVCDRKIDHLIAYAREFPADAQRYREELELLLPPPVMRWQVACAREESEAEEHLPWRPLSAASDGRLSLMDACEESGAAVCMARTELSVPTSRTVAFAAGGDGPFRLWLNDALVHVQPEAKRIHPFQVIGSMDLPAGQSRVVVRMRSPERSGRCDLFLRILDAEVAAGCRPEDSSSDPKR